MNKLIWYDKYKGLQGNVLSKARKFNKLKLIEEIKPDVFKVYPIPGYNKTTYDVIKFVNYWVCNCQYFRKNEKICSHILAVKLFLEIRE